MFETINSAICRFRYRAYNPALDYQRLICQYSALEHTDCRPEPTYLKINSIFSKAPIAYRIPFHLIMSQTDTQFSSLASTTYLSLALPFLPPVNFNEETAVIFVRNGTSKMNDIVDYTVILSQRTYLTHLRRSHSSYQPSYKHSSHSLHTLAAVVLSKTPKSILCHIDPHLDSLVHQLSTLLISKSAFSSVSRLTLC